MKHKFDAAQVPQFIALESVSVASPCHADWDAMTGDDRSRFCPSCAKNVYNLSAMTRDEAQLLLQEKEGRLCVRYYLREDGTMLTQDCPVGVAAIKERSPSFALWTSVASLALLAAALVSPGLVMGAHAQPDQRPSNTTATSTPEPVAPALETMMGDVAAAPAPTATALPTPKPTLQVPPLMGKVAVPRMGRVATPPIAQTPQHTTTPQPTTTPKITTPRPTMGLVALPAPPHKKPTSPSKRSSNSS